ncbi:F-box only protein 39-like [Watersipora subatra]|uniref:F-box only protein 39-like n=1 Tax=Watersipora subatra TaxID=2589382 RepID=UPI00355C81EA
MHAVGMNKNIAMSSDEDDVVENVANNRSVNRPGHQWFVTFTDVARETESDDGSQSDCVVLAPAKRKLKDDQSQSISSTTEHGSSKKRFYGGRSKSSVSSASESILNGPWARLPQPIVVQIMSYLNNKSKLNMALTCKAWSQLLSSARLWRNLILELSSFQTISKSTVQFSKMYSQLKVFRMHYMELDRYWRYEKRREKLVNSLAQFLSAQRKLKAFVMNNAQTEVTQGCHILESAAKYSSNQIELLNLEDFFQSRVAAFRVPRYITAINRFTCLKQFFLNYNYLNEDIIDQLAAYAKLHILSIKVYKNDPHYHRISTISWAKLKRACPHLEVNFEFDQIPAYHDIRPILVAPLPLHGLYIWSGYEENEEDWRICDSLKHISKNFSKTLESFTLEIENESESIDESLISMLCSCPALYHIDVNAIINTDTVENICKLQEDGKINLQSMYITITGAPDTHVQDQLDLIAARYANLTHDYRLDFQFTADVIIPSAVDYAARNETHDEVIVVI